MLHEIHSMLEVLQDHSKWQIDQGVITILEGLSERDSDLYYEVVKDYLSKGDYLNVNPWVPVSNLVASCGIDVALKAISIPDYSSKSRWIFSFYQHLPKDKPHYLMGVGTPEDIGDDVYVYPNPDAYNPPAPGDGWASYRWDIPSDFVGGYGELPAGWNGGTGGNTTFPSDMTWQDMMTNVGRLEIRTLYPDYAATYEQYQMGADNMALYYEGGVVATENESFGGVKALYR